MKNLLCLFLLLPVPALAAPSALPAAAAPLRAVSADVVLAGAASALDGHYVLGEGDVVKITVHNQPDLATETQVGSDGSISFPLLGAVPVGGLSFGEAERRIGERLVKGGYLREATVTLLLTQFRSRRLSVLGEVNQPGRLALDGAATLADALALAGGVAPGGGDKVVLLRTAPDGSQSRSEYRISTLLGRSAAGQPPVPVGGGDVVFVPRAEQFYVHGEVQKPGVFRLDRPTSVMQALSMSGGFSPRANTRHFIVYRRDADGQVRERELAPTDAIVDEDVLFIRESWF